MRGLLLEAGRGCWKVAIADRAAVLIDGQAYFDAAMATMEQARRSIHFLNWAFEPNTPLRPGANGVADRHDEIAAFLKRMVRLRPGLDVRILCWESALPVAATQSFFPLADRGIFADGTVKFVLDADIPLGACHHQKVIVVDDSVAFCGSSDIGPERWDTEAHLDDDPRRRVPGKRRQYYVSRHEVMAMVDGAAALALGELFRARWRRRTGEALPPPPAPPRSVWPASIPPMFENVRVGLSRDEPAWRGSTRVDESEALHLSAIAAARRLIYMENQYFTSELMAEALAKRLSEADGPEVLLISGGRSPSYFDRMTMDPARSRFIQILAAADRGDRFRIYSPVTAAARPIIVHAKLTIIDDRLLRVGSANLDNRSFGFDTECDLSLEATDEPAGPTAAAIARLRNRLVAHWLGCSQDAVETAAARARGLCRAVESLRLAGSGRLRPIAAGRPALIPSVVAKYHIGDPMGPQDSFRPWKRRSMLVRKLEAEGLAAPAPEPGGPV